MPGELVDALARTLATPSGSRRKLLTTAARLIIGATGAVAILPPDAFAADKPCGGSKPVTCESGRCCKAGGDLLRPEVLQGRLHLLQWNLLQERLTLHRQRV